MEETRNVVDLAPLPRKTWAVVGNTQADSALTLHRAVAIGYDAAAEAGVFLVMNRTPKWVPEPQVVLLTTTVPEGDLETFAAQKVLAGQVAGKPVETNVDEDGMSQFLSGKK